ncbi:MAG: PEP-CTERM sorting domain-containing protein [Isosphaeraceae bacterium]
MFRTSEPTAVTASAPATAQPLMTSYNLAPSQAMPVTVVSPPTAPAFAADAYIKMDSGPFPSQAQLTTADPKPWYESPAVTQVFQHTPTSTEQQAFTDAVFRDVQKTFDKSGVPVTLTNQADVSAAHTLSVVAGATSPSVPEAVGMAVVGGDGFSFIDKLNYASSVEELEQVVAHNISHELMHTFGGEHHDTTGQYLDSAVTPWAVMADPNAVFGPDSVKELLTRDFRAVGQGVYAADGQEVLSPTPVPEPTTLAMWGLAASAAVILRRRSAA